jgi:(p)ppGpp synthase/HD superfamily hydrolase
MHAYAQINVQLFNQLRSEGYSKEDRERVREAYEFAMRLFTGMFLPSGKTFIDHLVGTASVLASLHVRVDLIIAALIHAAYLHGNFGGIRKGISDATRKQVQLAVGLDVEKYVVRYELMPWDPSIFSTLHDNIDKLDSLDRDVLLMRLANDFEHNLDLGSLYRDNWYRYINQHGSVMVSMAEKLGFPSLSAEMAQVFKDIVSTQLPLEPCIETSEPAAYLVVPKSYHEPFWVVYWPKARRLGSEVLNTLRRVRWRASTLIRGLLRADSSGSKPKVSS